MKIEKKFLAEWARLYHNGDQRKLSEIPDSNGRKVSVATIQKALKKGKCSPELFVVIQKFYNERRRVLEQEGSC